MGRVFYNKQFSDYLGENRAILDLVESFIPDGSPVPSPTPSNTPTPTPSVTPTQVVVSPTPTMTPTTTSTNTPTVTQTPTQTGTPNPTPTSTPTPTPASVTFNIGEGFSDATTAVFVDTNDDVYVAGVFVSYDGQYANGLVKLDDNGVLDTTFQSGANTYTFAAVMTINGMCNDETGNYLYIWGAASGTGQRIRKIDKVTGLDVWTATTRAGSTIIDAVVDPSGLIYITGQFTTYGGVTRNRIARLLSNGSLDTTAFTGAGFNAQGLSLVYTRIGTLLVTGDFTTYNGVATSRLLEIELTTFTDTGFWGAGSTQTQKAFQRQDNGDYVFVGNAGNIKGVTVGKVAKFNEGGTNIPYTTALGGIVPFGYLVDEVNNFIYISNQQGIGIRRYEYGSGATDTAFETALTEVIPVPTGIAQQYQKVKLNSNNKIYWTDRFNYIDTTNNFNRIVRLDQDGGINTTNT